MTAKGNACLLGLLLVAAFTLLATTWGIEQYECPVCHTKNSFSSIMSYGSYVYSWPSKFQNIFWPATDSNVLYSCKHCHLTLFMWDFKNLPASKVEECRRALANVTLAGKYETYNTVPMSERLEIAERVYGVLDKDDEFWAWFYRVQGYHLAREKKLALASTARAKALEHGRNLLNDPKNNGKKKELLLSTGAMHHFLGDDVAARNDMKDALKVVFEDSKHTADENKNINTNLDSFLKEYLERIDQKTVPNDDGTDEKTGESGSL